MKTRPFVHMGGAGDIAGKLILSGILAAATLACSLMQVWPDSVLLVAICGSLIFLGGRRTWAVLAFWSYFWLSWSGYEIFVWAEGNTKFGHMSLPYGFGGLVFGLAAVISARAAYSDGANKEPWLRREWRNFKEEIGWR